MPVQIKRDSRGCFARWGENGAKYYYECGNAIGQRTAKKKAKAQGIAIGELKDVTINDRFQELIRFLRNDNSRT